jgi:putative component of toxin-antitoxin plasmid stabilization module
MRKIILYTLRDGSCPIKDFFDSLPHKVFQKVSWVLRLISEVKNIPSTYFKKLKDSDDIWECRIKFGSNIYRLFCFFSNGTVIVLTHGIIKKSQKIHPKEIKKAEEYKKNYLRSKK